MLSITSLLDLGLGFALLDCNDIAGQALLKTGMLHLGDRKYSYD